jgi:hypothetical protein
MTTDVVFYPHALRATAIAGGAELFCTTLLDDITTSNNFQDLTSYASAQVGPQFTGAHMAAPDFRFSSPQLGTLLSVLAAGEYYISRDLSAYNVDGWYRAGHNLGQREADATLAHLQLRMQANAMLAMESLAADEGQLATAASAWRQCSTVKPGWIRSYRRPVSRWPATHRAAASTRSARCH